MSDDGLRGPQLEAAISNAMVRILHEFYGKGPARARSYVFDGYVFAILDDVLTTVERTLVDGGEQGLVREVRMVFEDLMTATFVAEVEQLTGRRVLAYHSQVLFEPDMAIEMFVLDPADAPSAPAGEGEAGDVHSAVLDEPGRTGDVDRLPAAEGPATREPDVEVGRPRGREQGDGQLRTAISNALVRVTREFYGRGPTRAKTFLADDYVFCVLEDLLTTVEGTLLRGGQAALVRRLRTRFQGMKGDAYADEVAKLAGRDVRASSCQVVFDPDVVFQLFVLEPPGATGTAGVREAVADVSSVAEEG